MMSVALRIEDKDFKHYGIQNGPAEVWEDGQRLDHNNFKPGEYEWWYADGHLDDGGFFSFTYQVEADKDGNPFAFILINFADKDGVVLSTRVEVDIKDVKIKKDFCDVQFGKHYIKSLDGLNKYEIYLDANEIEGGNGIHIILDKTVPTFRPGTGYWDANGLYFAWLCTVPSATISGEMTLRGKSTAVTGNGYHDHNWGNSPMNTVLEDWYWSRAEVDGICVVTSSVRFKEEHGGLETKFAYLAKDNEVLINAVNDDVVFLEGEKVAHPESGKKISSDCMYIVKNDSGEYNYIRFQGGDIVATFPFGEDDEWETYYARYISETILDLKINGEHFKGEAHSTLESMDFKSRRK